MRYKVNIRLGRKVKKYREELGLTQEELSDKLGMHYTSLSRIERGEANPPVYTVFRISKVLKKKMKDLFNRRGNLSNCKFIVYVPPTK